MACRVLKKTPVPDVATDGHSHYWNVGRAVRCDVRVEDAAESVQPHVEQWGYINMRV